MTMPPPTMHHRPVAPGMLKIPAVSDENVVPYDYGATFEVAGTPGAIRQDVINISPDGMFVAVAIGYGFEEDRARPLLLAVHDRVGPSGRALRRPVTRPANFTAPARAPFPAGAVFGAPSLIRPGDVTLGEIPAAALISGFRVNPTLEGLVFGGATGALPGNRSVPATDRELADAEVSVELLEEDGDGRRPTLFQQMRAPAEISFLFSMLDSSSGRELQDEPTHNLASLGTSRGERPFRWLAQPITFMPRSTMRLQVIERSEGVRGTLFIVLYGYKVLGSARCAEPLARQIAAEIATRTEMEVRPTDRVIPFDYVTTFALAGRPGNAVEAEATVNAEGGFVATSVGYGLLVEEQSVRILWENADDINDSPLVDQPAGGFPQPPPILNWDIRQIAQLRRAWLDALEQQRRGNPPAIIPPEPLVNLAFLPLRLLPANALAEGIRIRPDFVRVAFQNNGRLADAIPVSWLDQLFERLNRPGDVSFRYTVYDGGRGRELQNQPLHNIAGLGIATGERPFKKLARPLLFLPRSVIRVRVDERFGRGTLFIVFHGYKALSAPGGMR